MLISKLGELGLIARIKKFVKNSPAVIKGIGEDCAAVKYDRYRYMLLTCDMLIEDVDFTSQDSPYLIGRKAIGSSISDIAAKGGLPRHVLVSLGLPKNKTYRFIRDLYRGIDYWGRKFNIDIVGGDISSSRHLVIDISMFGLVKKANFVPRSGARIEDIIFVTGKIGLARSGRHLRFKPRLEEARYLVKNYKVNSMMDISDGLALDLSRILRQSRTGAVIYEELIPVGRSCTGIREALSMGEDFELLFTLSVAEARRLLASGKKIYSAIGQVVEEKYGLRLIGRNSKDHLLRPKGFEHF